MISSYVVLAHLYQTSIQYESDSGKQSPLKIERARGLASIRSLILHKKSTEKAWNQLCGSYIALENQRSRHAFTHHIIPSQLPHQMALKFTPLASTFYSPSTPRFLFLSQTSLLKQPFSQSIPSIKQFSTSSAKMTISPYFDVSWHGPVLDANGKPTSDVKGETKYLTFLFSSFLFMLSILMFSPYLVSLTFS